MGDGWVKVWVAVGIRWEEGFCDGGFDCIFGSINVLIV